jgi:hypothetical protein
MPRRPRPITYREALDALLDARLVIIRVAAMPLQPPEAREDLLLLARRLSLLMTRDNGRR